MQSPSGMGQSLEGMNSEADIIRICSYFEHSDEECQDDLPPLIEILPNKNVTLTKNTVTNQINTTVAAASGYSNDKPEYETAGLVFVGNDDDIDDIPQLHESDPDKIPVTEPVVYKRLIAQGEEVLLPESVVKAIPYIDTLLSGRFSTSQNDDGVIKTDEFKAGLLRVIVRYAEDEKKYKLLACLKPNEDILELLEMFRFLALKPPIDTSLSSIRSLLSEPPSIGIMSQSDVINFAFALFYARGQINWKKECKLRNMVYNTIQYLFKNKNLAVKPRAKYHMKHLVLKCVTFSYNQYPRVMALEVTESLDSSDTEEVCYSHDDSDDDIYDSDSDIAAMMHGLLSSPYDYFDPYVYHGMYDSDDSDKYCFYDDYLNNYDDDY